MTGFSTMDDKNPHNICTWNDNADCSDCSLHGKLICKWEGKRLAGFAAIALPALIASGFGVHITGRLTGNWSFLTVYVAFLILFFTVIEARILCRHCPFYTRSGRIIRCHANHGLPKVWEYDPSPMSRFEKTSLLLCFAFFGLFPILTEAYGMWTLYTDPSSTGLMRLSMLGIVTTNLVTVIAFLYLLSLFYCPHCVNFSCPLNGVPDSLVREYLDCNPVMKKAWEAKG
jgi:hypothetical protein